MRVVLSVFALLIFISFGCNKGSDRTSTGIQIVHRIVAKEVLNTSSYTYILANENEDHHQWLAISKMTIRVGETYLYQGGAEMRNFKSKELERTFESILFLDEVVGISPDENVDRIDDGITVADIFSNKDKYDGKLVTIRGMVTKFRPDILDKNWIHIQDGTDYEGYNDLTVTSDTFVRKGDVVTFEGKICTDKDFGQGYFYNVILEDSKIIN